MSSDLSPLLRLLRSHQLDDFENSDLEEFPILAAAATGRGNDDGRLAKTDLDEKRTDARRCFYHAVNCW